MNYQNDKDNAVYFQRLEDKLDKLIDSVQQLNVNQAEQAKDTVQLQKEMLSLHRDLEDHKRDNEQRIGELEKVQYLHKSSFKKLWGFASSIVLAFIGAVITWWVRGL